MVKQAEISQGCGVEDKQQRFWEWKPQYSQPLTFNFLVKQSALAYRGGQNNMSALFLRNTQEVISQRLGSNGAKWIFQPMKVAWGVL